MEAPFVIKFIETKWHDKQTLVSVSESEYSLKLEQTGNNAFSAHTTIYPKVDELRFAQLAIKTKQGDQSPPYIAMPNGERRQLESITDPASNEEWWVEPAHWDAKQRVWRSEARRTAGQIDLLPVFSHRLLLVTSAFGSFRICGGKMRKQDMHSISICRASA